MISSRIFLIFFFLLLIAGYFCMNHPFFKLPDEIISEPHSSGDEFVMVNNDEEEGKS